MVLPKNSLLIKRLSLVLGNSVSQQTGTLLEPVVEVADEKVVDVGDIETVIPEILVLLEADGVVHRLDGVVLSQVLLAENEQAHAVPMAVKAARHLGHLAFQDAAHRDPVVTRTT